MTYKRDLQQRLTKETYKRDRYTHISNLYTTSSICCFIHIDDLQKRPTKRDLQKRPTEETFKKRPTKETDIHQQGFTKEA